MTPKERNTKTIVDLENMVAIQSTPGNWNHDPYMHGYANGLILALATAKGEDAAFLPAPAKWLDDSYNVAPEADPVDTVEVNSMDEDMLVGMWIAEQRATGAKTIDLEKVEVIREGIAYALDLRTPV